MQIVRSKMLLLVLKLLVCALILKVTVGVIMGYRDYMPPDFDSDFLYGRESYFWAGYQWPFHAHIASGPCSLLFGMILLSERFRLRFASWHRYLGRLQTACVLFIVVPSGAWMALYAQTGSVAGVGFVCLAAATGLTVLFGWRSAVRRRFAEHRRWMWRCYLLLCSAIVLRLIGGIAAVAGIQGDWPYPLAAWISWLLPLGVFEFMLAVERKHKGTGIGRRGRLMGLAQRR